MDRTLKGDEVQWEKQVEAGAPLNWREKRNECDDSVVYVNTTVNIVSRSGGPIRCVCYDLFL